MPLKEAKKRSILLIGNYRPTLPLAKLLSSKGYTVIAGVANNGSKEIDYWKSRYVSSTWNHVDGEDQSDFFFSSLQDFCTAHPEVEAIFPVIEDYVRLFAIHQEWHKKLPPLIMAPPSVVNQCVDKFYMMNLIKKQSIPIAPFALARTEGEFQQTMESMGFPMVIRPAQATVALCFKKAIIAYSKADIDELSIDWTKHPEGVILQRKVEGIRHSIAFTAYEGRICGCLHFIIHRTNSYDETGVAVSGITVEPDRYLKQYTETLIKALNYSGVGCAQYIVNDKTGETCYLEINPRLPGHLTFQEFAGLRCGNFLMDMILKGKPDTTPFTGPAGIRFSWICDDIIAAKTAWRKRQISTPKAILWFFRITESALRSDVDVLFPRKDIKPGLLALARALPGLSRLLNKKPNRYRRASRNYNAVTSNKRSGVSGETV